ncbi:Starch-binding associating with outer membrane [Spirosomataceae bacterium TFI 002]|nr:Starch-binding associating with outer membrane [Spirosomataceae bacterium TFI 002]
MKSNSINKIFLLTLLASLSLTSCEDFLTEDNRSNVTAESYYITKSGFEALINANYSQLRDVYGGEPWLFSAGTDLYAEGRSQEPEGLSQYSDLNPSSSGVNQLYNTCYSAIQLANQALHYADLTEQSSSVSTSKGEVKFLRALAYFNLVQTYGGVALVKEYINEPVLEFERNSAEEVYAFIISDLEEAINLVNDGANNGRVNKRAVQHLLGKVYLTRGYESFGTPADFSTASSILDQAIAGQGLDIPYTQLWRPENDGNAETLFAVQYSAASISADPFKYGNSQARYFGPYLGGSEVAGNAPQRSYNLLPTDFALGLFTEDDDRWEGSFMVRVYDRYYDEFDVDDKSSLGIFHYYAPAWTTAEDSIAFVTKYPSATYHQYGSYSSQTVSSDYQTIPLKKFDDPKSSFGGSTSTRDIVIARLGETYLLAAEAYLKAGDAAKGLERLNVVRTRAGVAPATMGEFDIDYILDERARELLGEYHRWFDLKRTGKLVERTAAHHRLISVENFNGANGELKILRPIPQAAIDLNQNRNFPQNPAYN